MSIILCSIFLHCTAVFYNKIVGQILLKIEIQYRSTPNDGMHMAVNMEPSMRYFQINSIPCSAAYGPQIKEWVSLKRENNGWN
jgi:hypothetical protein